MAAPTADDVEEYLLNAGVDSTPEEIAGALAAEKAAQKARCRVPADDAEWPADLVEALYRRVHRNLTMRGLPLGLVINAADDGQNATTRVGNDLEVRRLEAPHRRLVVG